MEKNIHKSLSEIWVILQNTEKWIIEKIPSSFINFIEENKDDNFYPEINFDDKDWESKISEDAQIIMALIYRDYITSKEEREQIIAKEREYLLKCEKGAREKYNPDNLFKKRL